MVGSVVTISRGVCLWVFLVVRELLDGFTSNDTLNIMQRCLDSFPTTLETVSQHMLDCVFQVYRLQTAQIFQVSVSYSSPLLTFYYSFMNDINDGPGLFCKKTHPPSIENEILVRRDTMQRRLDAWCKGLRDIVEESVKKQLGYTSVDMKIYSFIDLFETLTWLQFCNSIILRIRHFLVPVDGLNGDPIEQLVRFAKESEIDGVATHTVTTMMSEAGDAVNTATITLVMGSSLEGGHRFEIISWLVLCAEMAGLSSKLVFHQPFESFQMIDREANDGNRDLNKWDILDTLRVISSTGYKLDKGFVFACFPDRYTELIGRNLDIREAIQELKITQLRIEEDGPASVVKRTNPQRDQGDRK
ncbi:hypothetical protein F5Y07DRAFT_409507 [Xylaria sp. FL0933]|nr:hypothetical protein F5Y07DRAFT_409507 [Xylaria sp. FL0933]